MKIMMIIVIEDIVAALKDSKALRRQPEFQDV